MHCHIRLVLCYDRPNKLDRAIRSLLNVRGVSQRDVLISQDGSIEEVVRVIKKWNMAHIRHKQDIGLSEKPHERIAHHYKFAIQAAFDKFRDAPGVVIVEDDLIFSPDFMEYFLAVAPAVEVDPTLWIASVIHTGIGL